MYKVQPETGPNKTRVLHRNLLLPCDFLPVEEDTQERKKTERRKPNIDRGSKGKVKQKERDPDSSSEDESDLTLITTRPAQPVDQVQSQLRVEADEFWPQVPDREREQDGEKDDCQEKGDIERES